MSNQNNGIEAKKNEIIESVRQFKYKTWVYKDFKKILEDDIITNILKIANIETASRKYYNRHGIEHGINVAQNISKLYWLIHYDYIGSNYIDEYDFSKDETFFTLLTAGYIHDCGRFFDPEINNHEEKIAEVIRHLDYYKGNNILNKVTGEKAELIIAKIQELCMCHEKKYVPSGKVEIAIVKLADALDCDKNRIYNIKDKPDFPEEYPERVKTIVFNDKKPERYFGPESIEKVELNPKESEGIVEISLYIKSSAAYGEIKSIIEILKASRVSEEKTVKDFSNRIRIRVIDPNADPFTLYPLDEVFLPGACILSTGYDIDIIDDDGTSCIKLPVVIKNEKNSGGIKSHIFMLGGFEKENWQDIEKNFYEITRDFKDLSEIKDEDMIPINPPEYMYSTKKGKNHFFRIIFPKTIAEGETIRLLGIFKWNKYFNINKDEMLHIVATETEHLFFNIKFPENIIPESFANSKFIIQDKQEKTISIEENKPIKMNNKTHLRKVVEEPRKTEIRYLLQWNMN